MQILQISVVEKNAFFLRLFSGYKRSFRTHDKMSDAVIVVAQRQPTKTKRT